MIRDDPHLKRKRRGIWSFPLRFCLIMEEIASMSTPIEDTRNGQPVPPMSKLLAENLLKGIYHGMNGGATLPGPKI